MAYAGGTVLRAGGDSADGLRVPRH